MMGWYSKAKEEDERLGKDANHVDDLLATIEASPEFEIVPLEHGFKILLDGTPLPLLAEPAPLVSLQGGMVEVTVTLYGRLKRDAD